MFKQGYGRVVRFVEPGVPLSLEEVAVKGYDAVPAMLAAAVGVGADPVLAQVALPGPKESEWTGAVIGVLVLVVRELVWWLRNRKK